MRSTWLVVAAVWLTGCLTTGAADDSPSTKDASGVAAGLPKTGQPDGTALASAPKPDADLPKTGQPDDADLPKTGQPDAKTGQPDGTAA